MPEGWSAQSDDDFDDFNAWLVRRNAQVALRQQADNVARNLWNQSIQSGDNLYAGNPSDLTAIGLAALDGAGSYATGAANDDDQGGSGGAFNRPAAATGEGSVHNSFGAVAGRADVGGPYPSSTRNNSRQHRSPISQDQDRGPVPSLPNGANAPTVSELEVVGRPAASTPHPGFFDSLNQRTSKEGPPDWDEFTVTDDFPPPAILEELPHVPVKPRPKAAGGPLAPIIISAWCALAVVVWL